MACDIFDVQHILIEFTTIGGIKGAGGLVNSAELHKGIVSFHVNTDQLSIGLKQHLEVFALGGFFVEVYDEEGLGGLNVPASVIFLAFNAAIASGELGAKSVGDLVEFPVG